MNKIYQKLAWYLPKKLVYWCFIRVWAQASVEKYPNTEAGKVTCQNAARAWEELFFVSLFLGGFRYSSYPAGIFQK